MAASSGYRYAIILQTAVKLDLFTLISSGTDALDGLVKATHADKRALARLLEACCGIGWIEKVGGKYVNAEAVERHLVRGEPDCVAFSILHGYDLYLRWGTLYEVVMSGKATSHPEASDETEDARVTGNSVAYRATRAEIFAGAMDVSARSVAPILAKNLDLSYAKTLLDVGGGPGRYTEAFLLANPQMRATILDLPDTVEVAKRRLMQTDIYERIDFLLGSYFDVEIPGAYDAVFLSSVIHSLGDGDALALFTRLAPHVSKGGRMLIRDFYLNEERTGPEWPAVFSINMLVQTDGGRSYTVSETESLLNRAGFKRFEYGTFGMPEGHGLLTAFLD
jgi:SAM-dependent methyltransferase